MGIIDVTAEHMLKTFKNGDSITRVVCGVKFEYKPTERNIALLGLFQEGRINSWASCLNQMDREGVSGRELKFPEACRRCTFGEKGSLECNSCEMVPSKLQPK